MSMNHLEDLLPRDPRVFQIMALSSLLAFGWSQRAFDILPLGALAIVIGALTAQGLGSLLQAVKFDPKSAVITSLSLILLIRSESVLALGCLAALAVGTKFALRLGGKHIFNPANAGIVGGLIFAAVNSPGLFWTTPGQWGTAIWLAALMAGAGMFVTYRAARLDIPLVFLGVFAGLIFARAIWLGDPLTIPALRLQNGALILFAFFMISDPKTTPDGKFARLAFASAAAAIAFWLTFFAQQSDGLFYALAIVCIIRPLMEWLDPARHYRWGDRPGAIPGVLTMFPARHKNPRDSSAAMPPHGTMPPHSATPPTLPAE